MDHGESGDSGLQDLLAASAVFPEQYWQPQPRTVNFSGERALMWAVLTDGIECYRRNARSVSGRQRIEFAEAERWLFSTNWEWPFSFVNLCEAFGFNPAGIRRALRRCRQSGRAVLQRRRFRPVALRAA
jgi:hypothetical protein